MDIKSLWVDVGTPYSSEDMDCTWYIGPQGAASTDKKGILPRTKTRTGPKRGTPTWEIYDLVARTGLYNWNAKKSVGKHVGGLYVVGDYGSMRVAQLGTWLSGMVKFEPYNIGTIGSAHDMGRSGCD